ncbi:MAG: aminoacetone oxidase family FAD-binding enzyme, partial [Opitutae bacterium]|nr:aminoacetone oxidase family FAD-binding enzyme [Opitutae bacterium]
MKCAVIGGGAAGFFCAITLAEENKNAEVIIFDSGNQFLRKVKISGGGRCNVTHACFDPRELVKKYPRGQKELLGAFYTWQPKDTVEWFRNRGVQTKTEEDGRMFPVSDQSQSIIDCLKGEAKRLGIDLKKGMAVKSIVHKNSQFKLLFSDGKIEEFQKVCFAIGSMKSSTLAKSLQELGHPIQSLAPSLFAFDIKDDELTKLAGISVKDVSVRILPKGDFQEGPLLITHRGLSGPAILKLSAWEARKLLEMNYQFSIEINWLGNQKESDLRNSFAEFRIQKGQQFVKTKIFEKLPRRLWESILAKVKIDPDLQWAQLPKKTESL